MSAVSLDASSSDFEDDCGRPSLPRTASGRGSDDPRLIGEWKIGRELGRGASGRVKIARHAITGQYAAVKIVSKHALLQSRMSEHDMGGRVDRALRCVEREIAVLQLIDHPNVVRLYDMWETNGELYLVMEYIEGGELFDLLESSQGLLPLEKAANLFAQLAAGLSYCHAVCIAHRDLKPENLLIDSKGTLKIADFGMAATLTPSDTPALLSTFCGSPHYACPEIIRNEPYDGAKADAWACGVILYALLTKHLPFVGHDLATTFHLVQYQTITIPEYVHPLASSLVLKLLERDPSRRIKISEALSHPFLTTFATTGQLRLTPTLPDDLTLTAPIPLASISPFALKHLSALASDHSNGRLEQELESEGSSWLKSVYHMLLRNRSGDSGKASPAVEAPPSAASPSPSTESVPPRPQPPTPRRAGGSGSFSATSSTSTMTRPPHLRHRSAPSADDFGRLQSPLPLTVPESADVNMRAFFQQVADRLHTVEASIASNSPYQSVRGSPTPNVEDKENWWDRSAVHIAPTAPLTVKPSLRRALTDGQARPVLAERRVQIVEPRKREVSASSARSALSDDTTYSTTSSKKLSLSGTWLSGLFKPRLVETCAILGKHEARIARTHVANALAGMGVTVLLLSTPANTPAVLRCRTDDGTRFRVEACTTTNVEHISKSWHTVLTVTLDKGSVGTFRNVEERLRKDLNRVGGYSAFDEVDLTE